MDEKADSRAAVGYHEYAEDNRYPLEPPQSLWDILTSHCRGRTVRRFFIGAWLTLVAYVLLRIYIPSANVDTIPSDAFSYPSSLLNVTNKVALEVHIMSKCPDAKDCLKELVVPTMAKIHDKVDFRLSFIGSVDKHSDGVDCKHGPPECLGNMILLCAAKLYPNPIVSLGFANCMINKYKKIPNRDLVEDCAMEHGVDFSKVNNCISEEGEGIGLLRESIERSQDKGVQISCTVRLDSRVRCVRDGGEWTSCARGHKVDDLVKDVNDLYEDRNT